MRSIRALTLTLALGGTLALAACGGSSDEESDAAAGPSVEQDDDIASLVPDDVRDAGVLTVGVDPQLAPMVFTAEDGTTLTGFEADLARAAAGLMGLEVEFAPGDFSGLIAGLQAERYDTVMSFVVDTAEREETVDFVDYVDVGAGILVPEGNPEGIEEPMDLCGVTTVVGANSQGERTADALSEECQAAGQPPVDKLVVQDPSDVQTAISSGRAPAALNVSLVLSYTEELSPDQFDVAGEFFNEVPGGALFRKDDTELRDAFVAALLQLQEDGTFAELGEQYGIADSLLEGAPINAATAE
ncbi:ABC transporter substrate-binding protein [Blastococcus sp. SYSU D00820]